MGRCAVYSYMGLSRGHRAGRRPAPALHGPCPNRKRPKFAGRAPIACSTCPDCSCTYQLQKHCWHMFGRVVAIPLAECQNINRSQFGSTAVCFDVCFRNFRVCRFRIDVEHCALCKARACGRPSTSGRDGRAALANPPRQAGLRLRASDARILLAVSPCPPGKFWKLLLTRLDSARSEVYRTFFCGPFEGGLRPPTPPGIFPPMLYIYIYSSRYHR